jgi:hypothetical protein
MLRGNRLVQSQPLCKFANAPRPLVQCFNDGKSHWMADDAEKFGCRFEFCYLAGIHICNVANIGNFVKKSS